MIYQAYHIFVLTGREKKGENDSDKGPRATVSSNTPGTTITFQEVISFSLIITQ